MIEEHAVLAPSSMHRTVGCPGWIKQSAGVVEEETDASREGTAVHWVGETMLAEMVTCRKPYTASSFVGMTAPNGILIEEEMAEAADLYYRSVMAVAGYGHLNELRVEQKVSCASIHPQCWGTPDAALWINEELTLHVWDLKYGHRRVRAFENWQLMTYAIGLLDEITGGQALATSPIKVIIHVVQPRCYDGIGPEDIWTVLAQDLRSYANIMGMACDEALGPNPDCHTGEHCRDCPGRAQCPTLLEAAARDADLTGHARPSKISPGAMAYERRMLIKAQEMIKFRLSAIETELQSNLRGGMIIPGLRMEQSYGRNNWTKSAKEIASIGDLLGVDLRKPDAMLTPDQAEAALKKMGVDASVIKGYYERKPGALKLVEDDGSEAKLAFQQEN
jgi:hypothetical protein